MKKGLSFLLMISVVLVIGTVVINTIRRDKSVGYTPSEEAEEQKRNDHFMDVDNAVYLYSDAVEGYRSPVHGAVAFNWELSSWLSRDDVPEDQVYRIFIRAFSSDEYDAFITKEISESRNKYMDFDDVPPAVEKELGMRTEATILDNSHAF